MRIVFPVEKDKGLNSSVYGHFGSAPLFLLVDTEKDSVEPLVNHDAIHAHGQCQPLKALGDTPVADVEAVVVGGIGGGALKKLNAAGIQVFRAVEGTIQDNVDLAKNRRLPEFTMDQTCAGHSAIGGCNH